MHALTFQEFMKLQLLIPEESKLSYSQEALHDKINFLHLHPDGIFSKLRQLFEVRAVLRIWPSVF